MATKQQPSAAPKNDAAASAKKKHVKKHTAAMREQEKQARRAAWNSHAAQEKAANEGSGTGDAALQAGQAQAAQAVEDAPVPVTCEPVEVEISSLPQTPAEGPADAENVENTEVADAENEAEQAPALEAEPEAVAAWAPLEPEAPSPEPERSEQLERQEPADAEAQPQEEAAAPGPGAAAIPAQEEIAEETAQQAPVPPQEEPQPPQEAQAAPAAEQPQPKKKAAPAPKAKKQRKRHYFATYVAMFTMLVVVVCAASILVMFSTSGNALFANTPDVELPNFNNLTRAQVEQDPTYQGFHLVFEEVYNDEKAEGVIFDQSPKAPKQVKENASITLRVSKGVHRVTVPDVIGWKKDTVREKLKTLDLSILVKTEVNKNKAVNTVLRTEPKAGATLQAGETVTVYVAAEPHDENFMNVPNCVGMSRDKAVKLIGNNGLVAQTRTVSSGMPAGTVVSQTPGKTRSVRRGSTVMLSISSGSGGTQVTGGQAAQEGQQLYPGGPTVGYGDGQVVPGSVAGHIHTWTPPDANGNQVCTVCAATRHVS